jgi:Fe-Mn family superoxide dismutase
VEYSRRQFLRATRDSALGIGILSLVPEALPGSPSAPRTGEIKEEAHRMSHTAIDFKTAKPSLWQMDGISTRTMDEHIKLYHGYVAKYHELVTAISGLSEEELTAPKPNPTYSQIRSMKVDITRAIGGIKNHEIYFNNIGGKGGEPPGDLKSQMEKDFGSYGRFLKEFRATGTAARGWSWLAWDYDWSRLFVALGDEQNTFPVWNASPILAMDVFEHAFFIDYGANKAGYMDAFFKNLDWADVEGRFSALRK